MAAGQFPMRGRQRENKMDLEGEKLEPLSDWKAEICGNRGLSVF
jgi:hypothetical protein